MAVAITTARVQWNGTWYTLTYNAETGAYEAALTTPAAPGYYTARVETTNSDGQSAAAEQTLLVKSELVPPVVTITTASGFYQNPATPIVFTLVDEAGGSGVNLDSLKMVLDGQTVTGAQSTAIENGYSCTYTPSGLSDGEHSITITVEDQSGNLSAPASLTWSIDTTAPTLAVSSPAEGLNTNNPALTIAGVTGDEGVGFGGLTVNDQSVPVTDGAFSLDVTLSEGMNSFTFVAADLLGNSTTLTRQVLLDTTAPVIEAVTLTPDFSADPIGNRFVLTVLLAPSPAPKAAETVTGTVNGMAVSFSESPALMWTALVPRGDGFAVELTASDAAGNVTTASLFFPDGLESKFDWTTLDFLNYWDLNRVERNTDFILRILRQCGYNPKNYGIDRDWAMPDIPTRSQIDRVRRNVDALQEGFLLLPEWREIVYNNTVDAGQMNAIEWDLRLLDQWLVRLQKGVFIYSGDVFAGEV